MYIYKYMPAFMYAFLYIQYMHTYVHTYVFLYIQYMHTYVRTKKDISHSAHASCSVAIHAWQRGNSRFIYPGSVLWIDYGPNPSTFLTDFKPATDNPTWEETFVWEYNKVTSKICVSVWDRCGFPRVLSAMFSFFIQTSSCAHERSRVCGLTLSLP